MIWEELAGRMLHSTFETILKYIESILTAFAATTSRKSWAQQGFVVVDSAKSYPGLQPGASMNGAAGI